MNLSWDKIMEYAPHIYMVWDYLTDAFYAGKSTTPEREAPTAAYREMLDEAISLNTFHLLRKRLKARGIDVDGFYEDLAQYFRRNPVYIPAWRESLASCASPEARVNMLEEMALAQESERDMLCQFVDQRHVVVKAAYERFFKARKAWSRELTSLPLEHARNLRAFLKTLSWLQRRQFELSIGGLTNTEDRRRILDEILAEHPNTASMAEIASTRGLIKYTNTEASEEVRSAFGEIISGFAGRISNAAHTMDTECASLARKLHVINQEKRQQSNQPPRTFGRWFIEYFSGR